MNSVWKILFLTSIFCLAAAQKEYTNKYDKVNVDSVLDNDRILTNYIKCLMDKGPCTPEGRELKKMLPDALATGCSKCTETQRKNSQKVFNVVSTRRPGDWNKLLNKYDPEGKYRARFAKKSE